MTISEIEFIENLIIVFINTDDITDYRYISVKALKNMYKDSIVHINRINNSCSIKYKGLIYSSPEGIIQPIINYIIN